MIAALKSSAAEGQPHEVPFFVARGVLAVLAAAEGSVPHHTDVQLEHATALLQSCKAWARADDTPLMHFLELLLQVGVSGTAATLAVAGFRHLHD